MDQAAGRVIEIAVNLDDVSGEVVGDALETLRAEGAVDVWATGISMKKGRPGVGIHVLCLEGDRERLSKRVIELTGAFGVRYREWERLVLERRHVEVETAYGVVRLKVGELDGEVLSVKPEFEDVKAAAEGAGTNVRWVMEEARRAAVEWRMGSGSEGGLSP